MLADPAHIQLQINNLLVEYPELKEDEVLRADMLEGATDFNEFLRMLERKRQEAIAMADGIVGNIKSLQARKQRFELRDEAMRNLMFKLLQWADLKKVELPEATLSIRAGSQHVVVVDEGSIPKKFWRKPDPVLDKIKIREALKDGKPVEGAALSNAESVLAIRVG